MCHSWQIVPADPSAGLSTGTVRMHSLTQSRKASATSLGEGTKTIHQIPRSKTPQDGRTSEVVVGGLVACCMQTLMLVRVADACICMLVPVHVCMLVQMLVR